MSDNPAVSVCVASYNHARFLSRCLDSVLQQTFQDFELVVVDDGSKDNSHEILLAYQAQNAGKIRYSWHPNHANFGISITTNTAIKLARGRYIAFIGSDDVWYPEKLAIQVSLLEEHPEYGYVYSLADYIDDQDRKLSETTGTDITDDLNPTGRMLLSCHQPAMTVVIRRSSVEEEEWFDKSLVYSDWDLMVRLTARIPAGFTRMSLAGYRIHGGNISKRIDPKVDLSRIISFTEAIRAKSKKIGHQLLAPRNQAILALQLSFLYFCAGEEKQSLDLLNQAYTIDESLMTDDDYLIEWLNQWKPDFYSSRRPHFGFWFIDHLVAANKANHRKLLQNQLAAPETLQFFVQRGIEQGQDGKVGDDIFADVPASCPLPGNWKLRVFKEIFPALLFEAARTEQFANVKDLWIKTIRSNPVWLLNRGVLKIGSRAFLKTKA